MTISAKAVPRPPLDQDALAMGSRHQDNQTEGQQDKNRTAQTNAKTDTEPFLTLGKGHFIS